MRAPHAVAVVITEPAYVGTVGNVAALAEITHAHDAPLIVDAAWAPHFGFHDDLPRHALQQGADAMVVSAHKTLPAWSQAAMVLARTNRLDAQRIETAVEVTHTTSPAGAILASIDASRALLARDGANLLGAVIAAVSRLRDQLTGIPGLVIPSGPLVDPTKVTLVLPGTGADGTAVEQRLLSLGMPLELADRDTIVAIVTMADDAARIEVLGAALETAIQAERGEPRTTATASIWALAPVTRMSPRAAFFVDREVVAMEAAIGRVSAALIAPYPPGIPVLAPGEEITVEVVEVLREAQDAGTRIAYAADPTLTTLTVVTNPGVRR
ncbi:MAG: hypothetical protein ABI131_12020 [Nostocoides sp.]